MRFSYAIFLVWLLHILILNGFERGNLKISYKINSMSISLSRRINTNLPWLGILLLIILSIAFLLPVLPNDFWWYLRLGQDILLTGKVPLVDTYSSTVFGQTLTYPMWLSAILMNFFHQTGGLTLTVLIRGFLIASFYLFLWMICIRRGVSGWLATLLTLACALIGANNWAIRPQIFIYPLFGFALFLLDSTIEHGNSPQIESQQNKKQIFRSDVNFSMRYLWLLPVALLWANLHGSVIILFFLVGPYFLFYQRSKKFLFILFITFLVTFINPRGPLLWVDSLQIIQATGNQFSQEWKPPINIGWQMNLFFLWFLIFIPLVTFSNHKLKIHEWVWFLGFGWMALSGVRYVIWFLALILILSAWLIHGFPSRKTNSLKFEIVSINIIFLLLFTLLPLTLLPGVREIWWQQSPDVVSKNTPIAATEWLKQQTDLPGPIFNDYVYGSYLIYALSDRPVWIDSRFYPFPRELWEEYLSISNAEPGWSDKLSQNQIGTLILDNTSQDNLIMALNTTSQYCQVYKDDISSIFSLCQ